MSKAQDITRDMNGLSGLGAIAKEIQLRLMKDATSTTVKMKNSNLEKKWWHRLAKVFFWGITFILFCIALLLFFSESQWTMKFNFETGFKEQEGDILMLDNDSVYVVKETFVTRIDNTPFDSEAVSFNCLKRIVGAPHTGSVDDVVKRVVMAYDTLKANQIFDCSIGGPIYFVSWQYRPLSAIVYFLIPLIGAGLLWLLYFKVIIYVAFGKDIPQ